LGTLIKQLGSKIYIFSKNSGMENAKSKNKTKTRLEFAKISNGSTKEAHNVQIRGNHPGKSSSD